jgi:hypothetical protein
VESGKDYTYRLSDVSTQGEVTAYARLTIKTDALPETTEMEKTFPNPFNPKTFIACNLAKDTDVNISVFDMRVVRSIRFSPVIKEREAATSTGTGRRKAA